MKFPALVLLSLLSFSCRDLDASESSEVATIGPKSDTYVITNYIHWTNDLNRRLSLVLSNESLVLLKLEGTHVLDKVGLAMRSKIFKKNGFEYIKSEDFLPLKLIPSVTYNNSWDLVDYESKQKIGSVLDTSYDEIFELCTGSAENLCEFTYDETNKNFSITMLPTASN